MLPCGLEALAKFFDSHLIVKLSNSPSLVKDLPGKIAIGTCGYTIMVKMTTAQKTTCCEHISTHRPLVLPSTSSVIFSIGLILVGIHLIMNSLHAASIEDVAIFGFGMKTPVEHLDLIPFPTTHQRLRRFDLGRSVTLEDIPVFTDQNIWTLTWQKKTFVHHSD